MSKLDDDAIREVLRISLEAGALNIADLCHSALSTNESDGDRQRARGILDDLEILSRHVLSDETQERIVEEIGERFGDRIGGEKGEAS